MVKVLAWPTDFHVKDPFCAQVLVLRYSSFHHECKEERKVGRPGEKEEEKTKEQKTKHIHVNHGRGE